MLLLMTHRSSQGSAREAAWTSPAAKVMDAALRVLKVSTADQSFLAKFAVDRSCQLLKHTP